MTFRAVLTVAFDWNGTLVDDAERACAAAGIVLERRGLPPLERDRFHEGFHLPLRTWIASLGVPAREVDEAIREWNQEIGDRPAELTAGARQAIEAMRSSGIHLGVVSAASLEALQRDLDRPALSGFAEQLAFIVGDAEPKRTAFATLAGARPRDFVYVGDTEYDMREARAAGVRSIGYAGGYRPASALAGAGADRIIGRLSELPVVLDGIRPGALAAGSDGSR
ncbi:MAG TPA: HAD family hydrolase [Candidatus Limnocylindria bacterium]|jgi:phosphoglycolate phosphatase-like HAD superfamily hydrolase